MILIGKRWSVFTKLHSNMPRKRKGELSCPHCGKGKIKTKAGVSSHIQQTPDCNAKEYAAFIGQNRSGIDDTNPLAFASVYTPGHSSENYCHPTASKRARNRRVRNYDTSRMEEDDDFEVIAGHNDELSADSEEATNKEEVQEALEYGVIPMEGRPDTSVLEDFQQYIEDAPTFAGPLTTRERRSIELMGILREGKASLRTYEEVMKWHYVSTGKLLPHSKLGSCSEFISRKILFASLSQRYHLEETKWGIIDVITLPSSKARAKIVRNDFRRCLQSLLADPRIEDDDYLFFDENPWAPPPELSSDDKENFIGDINTGRAYRESYAKYIKKPWKQVLLPIIFYIDGAATGQFANLPVTPLKFTLGIFNRKAREKPHLWRTLGYVPAISSERSRGRRQLAESGHVDAQMANQDLLENEGTNARHNVAAKAQDLHTMLSNIMEDVYELMKTGFIWDLTYKNSVYRSIEFVLFVPFFKVDTEEADRLCGSFTSRTKNIKQLCRYCCCPTSECDDPKAKPKMKTIKMIQRLVKSQDDDGLKELSQQMIDNALYPLRFGAHNGEGPHSACPLEMLHALLLGIFKYVRDCFFTQIGESSKIADEINALAVEYGELYQRQSDREKPKTKFSNGIQKGKLMAKEYRGVLLIMATILASSQGRKLLRKKKLSIFAQDDGLGDWSMLVETLLMWEVWLKSEEISHFHLKRAKKKHRYIMYLIRKVGNRTKGMGLKIMKYHAIIHMADDMMNFGVPMNFDTGADEAGHKPNKTAAKLTQKNKDTFDEQVCMRLHEKMCIDLAMVEIRTGRSLWSYYKQKQKPQTQKNRSKGMQFGLGGGEFEVQHTNDGHPFMKLRRKVRGCEHMKIEVGFINFVDGLLKLVSAYLDKLYVRTQFKDEDGTIYRATPLFKGGVWRDWVMMHWEGYDQMPNKLWGFLDLSALPNTNTIEYGGLTSIEPGIYAIVESAVLDADRIEELESELFVPITTEVGEVRDNSVRSLHYYLASVQGFAGPAIVVPDIGGSPNGYLMLKRRETWRDDFEKWLASKYEEFPDFDDDPDQTDYEEESDLEETYVGDEEWEDESVV